MALNENQLYSKEFFFSGDLNFTPNTTYNLTSDKIESLSKEQLGDLIEEGMYYKLNMIPENASLKIHDILSKIVNKGKSNVIAIVL